MSDKAHKDQEQKTAEADVETFQRTTSARS